MHHNPDVSSPLLQGKSYPGWFIIRTHTYRAILNRNMVEEVNCLTSRHILLWKITMKYYQAHNGRQKYDRKNWKRFGCKQRLYLHSTRLVTFIISYHDEKISIFILATVHDIWITHCDILYRSNPVQSNNARLRSILREVHLYSLNLCFSTTGYTYLIHLLKITMLCSLRKYKYISLEKKNNWDWVEYAAAKRISYQKMNLQWYNDIIPYKLIDSQTAKFKIAYHWNKIDMADSHPVWSFAEVSSNVSSAERVGGPYMTIRSTCNALCGIIFTCISLHWLSLASVVVVR